MKILLDTDIGTDCDDVVCLAYLLLRDDCELVGITTVGRDPGPRAAIARTLCRHFGQDDVPVIAGAGQPLLPNYFWWEHRVNQDGICDAPADPERPAIEAVQFMREVIRDNPGEVVLVTIGPATNAGLLAMSDPEAMRQLKAVYTMGGRVQGGEETPKGECNAMLDPAAFHALLAAPIADHLIAGTDVTGKTGLSQEQVTTILAGERLAIVRACIHACAVGFGKDLAQAGTGMHDPLTAALVFDPSFATTRRGRMRVRFTDRADDPRFRFQPDQVSGHTPCDFDDAGPHRITTGADLARYHQHVDEVFARAR